MRLSRYLVIRQFHFHVFFYYSLLQLQTFILFVTYIFQAEVWRFRSVILKSWQTAQATFLPLLYICQTEPQQEENNEPLTAGKAKGQKHHFKCTQDVIQFHCYCWTAKLNVFRIAERDDEQTAIWRGWAEGQCVWGILWFISSPSAFARYEPHSITPKTSGTITRAFQVVQQSKTWYLPRMINTLLTQKCKSDKSTKGSISNLRESYVNYFQTWQMTKVTSNLKRHVPNRFWPDENKRDWAVLSSVSWASGSKWLTWESEYTHFLWAKFI